MQLRRAYMTTQKVTQHGRYYELEKVTSGCVTLQPIVGDGLGEADGFGGRRWVLGRWVTERKLVWGGRWVGAGWGGRALGEGDGLGEADGFEGWVMGERRVRETG